MIKDLPPAKNPGEYSRAERVQITRDAAEAARLLAHYLARLVELDEEIKRRGD